MITRTSLASTFIAAFLAGSPLLAHHSANAQFDTKQDVTLIGVVTKVENINPHSWWHVEVKGPDGKVTKWKLESLSPNGLIRQGLKTKTPGPWEVYDLEKDQGEANDLAKDHADLIRQTEELLRREVTPNPVFPVEIPGVNVATR